MMKSDIFSLSNPVDGCICININVSLVWFSNLFGVKVPISSLLKVQQSHNLGIFEKNSCGGKHQFAGKIKAL